MKELNCLYTLFTNSATICMLIEQESLTTMVKEIKFIYDETKAATSCIREFSLYSTL